MALKATRRDANSQLTELPFYWNPFDGISSIYQFIIMQLQLSLYVCVCVW